MAPFAGLTPEAVGALLRDREVERRLPLAMGGPAGPTLCVGLLDGDWCLYHMAADDEGFAAFARAQVAANKPLYPEHKMRFLIPGEVVLRRSNRREFLAAYLKLEISFDASYRAIVRGRASAEDAEGFADGAASRSRGFWSWLRGRFSG